MPWRAHALGKSGFMATCVAFMVLASNASAEILDFNCTLAGDSHSFRLTIDPTMGLVSNEGGNNGRRWAARVTEKDIAWDEVYDDRRGHVANHFVLDRTTGMLHGSDISSSNEIANAICQKGS